MFPSFELPSFRLRPWSRKTLTSGVLLAATLAAHAGPPDQPAPTAAVAEIADQRCGGCHGSDGQGNRPMFPKLAGQNYDYLLRQMHNFRSGARKGAVMRYQLATLPDADVAELARYFAARPRIPDPPGDAGADPAGKRLFELGDPARGLAACTSCHGAAVPEARLPRLAGQHAAYLAEQLQRFARGTRLAGQSPTHPLAGALNEDDIVAVSGFISRLD